VTEQSVTAAEAADASLPTTVAEAATVSMSVTAAVSMPVTAVVTVAMEQTHCLVPQVHERTGEVGGSLEGFVVVILCIVPIGYRWRVVFAARREVVGRNLAGKSAVETPAIRHDPARAQSDEGGKCDRER
jgi:hypothetical protein